MLARNRHTTRIVLPMVGSMCLGMMLAVSQQNQAQKKPDKAKPTAPPIIESAKATPAKPAKEVAIKPDSKGRRGLDFYTKEARSTLFGEPQPPAPKPSKPIVTPPPPKPVPPAPVEVDPFADWAYTGTVSFNGQKMVLLENVKTKEGQYLHIGESFLGGQVSEINDNTVTLMTAGKMRQLTKQQNVNLVPLNSNAAPAGGAPGQPGQPPPPGAMPTSMPMNGGSTFVGNAVFESRPIFTSGRRMRGLMMK